MVEIILTDTKNKEKFLKLPVTEQRKKGIMLILNNNESDREFYNQEHPEPEKSGSVWFDDSFESPRKHVIPHFKNICKKGEKAVIDGLSQLTDDSNLNDNNAMDLTELCETDELPVRTWNNYDIHYRIKGNENTRQYWLKNMGKIAGEREYPYMINIDIPVSLDQSPEGHTAHEFLNLVTDIHSIKSELTGTSNLFDKHQLQIRKKRNKATEHGKKVKKFEDESILPKKLLGTTFEPEFPYHDEKYIWYGFLRDDTMTRQKIENNK